MSPVVELANEKLSPIRFKGIYVYVGPGRWKGNHYKVLHEDLLSVPQYTKMVLVKALDGEDAGMMFICTPWHFVTHYKLAESQP